MKNIILIVLIFNTIACCDKKRSIDRLEKKATCYCVEKYQKSDTIIYVANVVENQNSFEFITMFYDTTVIPIEAMGIEDNVVSQTINFKKNGLTINSYLVPSERHTVRELYGEDIKGINSNRAISINHIYSAWILPIKNELYFIFEGGENLIEKRSYLMITRQDGEVIYESYISKKGSMDLFMQEKGIYQKWKNAELYLTGYNLYPYELCCEKKSSLLPY